MKFYHTMALAVLFLGIPSIVLMSQSFGMIITIRKLEKFRSRSHSRASRSSGRNSAAGRKAFILYIAMYVKFVMLSYPYFVLNFIYEINPTIFRRIPVSLIRVFLLSRFLPCLINPCLYSLKNKDYRRAVNSVFRWFHPKLFYLNERRYSKRHSQRFTTSRVSEETKV